MPSHLSLPASRISVSHAIQVLVRPPKWCSTAGFVVSALLFCAVLVVPIRLLIIFDRSAFPFLTAATSAIVLNIVSLASICIKYDQTHRELQRSEAANSEANALRRAHVAINRNLPMDAVFDELFECIAILVPFDSATILLREDETVLLVAREAPLKRSSRVGLTFSLIQNSYLRRMVFEKKSLWIPDTSRERNWEPVLVRDRSLSWLGLPLIAGESVLGVLSLGSRTANRFTLEHLRLAKSLAVSTALAIDHARVRERAELYAASLRLRPGDPF